MVQHDNRHGTQQPRLQQSRHTSRQKIREFKTTPRRHVKQSRSGHTRIRPLPKLRNPRHRTNAPRNTANRRRRQTLRPKNPIANCSKTELFLFLFSLKMKCQPEPVAITATSIVASAFASVCVSGISTIILHRRLWLR